MSTKTSITRAALALGAAAAVTLPVTAAAAAPTPYRGPGLIAKDGRALAATGYGTVIAGRYTRAATQQFTEVGHGLVYLKYTGPGRYHGWYVQASDRHVFGNPLARFGHVGSRLVPYRFQATLFAEQARPGRFESLAVIHRHAGRIQVELLTGERYGQVALDPAAGPFHLPSAAQQWATTVPGLHR